MDARGPIQTYFILKNLDLKKVSAVYFGLDPWIYSKRYYMNRNNYMYLDFSLMHVFMFYMEHDKSAFLKRYKSLVKFILPQNFRSSRNKNFKIPKDFGSVALERKAANFDGPLEDVFQVDKYGWSNLQFKYLKKITELCSKKKIKLAVFIPPKRSDYSKSYKKDYGVIHNEFVNNLASINFHSPIFGKFDQLDTLGDIDNFADAYHLNKLGQKKYSEVFYELTTKRISVFSNDYLWFNN